MLDRGRPEKDFSEIHEELRKIYTETPMVRYRDVRDVLMKRTGVQYSISAIYQHTKMIRFPHRRISQYPLQRAEERIKELRKNLYWKIPRILLVTTRYF